MTDTEREFKVTVGRQHPITIEPINIVAAEAPGQAIRLKPTLYGEIHIECTAYGCTIGFPIPQPIAHQLFEAGLDLAEQLADLRNAKVKS